MGAISNSITQFLYDERSITVTLFAKKLEINTSSFRNTVYGSKPIKSVVVKLYEEDQEIFDMLPQNSKDLLPEELKKDYHGTY